MAGLKPIGPIAPNLGPALELSTLGCSSTHNKTLQVLSKTIGPVHHKAGPAYCVN